MGIEPDKSRFRRPASVYQRQRHIHQDPLWSFYQKDFAICGKDPKTGDTGEIRTHGFSALQALALDHSATVPINWTGLAPDWTFL